LRVEFAGLALTFGSSLSEPGHAHRDE
jgi:hypothetical protein